MQAVDKEFIEQMRRVQVAVAVNIVRETPSHLTPRRYATNLLSVLARSLSVNGQAENVPLAAHTLTQAACSEVPEALDPTSLPATATVSRGGTVNTAIAEGFFTTQHSGDVEGSSGATEGRTREAQQTARAAEHPLQTAEGVENPVDMMSESQHPTVRVTEPPRSLHIVTKSRNVVNVNQVPSATAAQCPRKVVTRTRRPAEMSTASLHPRQTIVGSREVSRTAEHIAELGVLVQHQRGVAGATRHPIRTGTTAQDPVQEARVSGYLGEVPGVAHPGIILPQQASHEQRPREPLNPKRQENWALSSSQTLAVEMERELERVKAGTPVDWLKCREIAQVLGDRVGDLQKADRNLEETCLGVTARFVAMLLRADREGPPPQLYDRRQDHRRRHHDRTAHWWCVLGKVTGVVTPLCTVPPLLLRSGNLLVEALINISRICGTRAGAEEDLGFELAYTVASVVSRVVARVGKAVMGNAKDRRPSPRTSEDIPQDGTAAGVPSLDAALAALEAALSQDQLSFAGDALPSPLASSPLSSCSTRLSEEDAGARRFAMDARWHLLYWKSVLEDECLALFPHGDVLPMFILQVQEIVQTISRICQDTEEVA
ncbi:uncharacterized protein LOC122258373 isoform X2 [Penaeus japonicus]|uniref:uncharacterized protein LOC122258373 isoform X2 n=1 Tax=Penaeus japonicus TaxID=27405 RepID=UPI001C7133DC|nr:uncharacterized protein LOC122258373 isoform X2 [Penaeus japonicus]